MMKFSVVIPVYKGTDLLLNTLKFYEKVKFPRNEFEVIVVSDEIDPMLKQYVLDVKRSYKFIFTEIEHRGQGAASNVGANIAIGEYILFTCQDAIPDRNILRNHISLFNKFNCNERIVSAGYAPYSRDYDNFHDFLANNGIQFAYYLLADQVEIKGEYLNCVNFALKRQLFREMGGFDERFPYDCCYSDFGIRWCRNEGKIICNKKAMAQRNHFASLESYCDEMVHRGKYTYKLHLKHKDYFNGTVEHFQNRIMDCFHMKNEEMVQKQMKQVRFLPDKALYKEIIEYFFFKGYYLESHEHCLIEQAKDTLKVNIV
ncbi:MAG: glycosyltransferase [Planctomycetes bacterium]|nr:glycosyltransferase [Planctomycetota bacterium]